MIPCHQAGGDFRGRCANLFQPHIGFSGARILKPYLQRMLLAIGAGLLVIVLGVYLFLRASLPDLDGTVSLVGLQAPVTVERDDLGVPTIHASNRVDLFRVLGFLHAQDRFFQMDIMRRSAAGELAALVGPAAVKLDERRRLFRLRSIARKVVLAATDKQKALFEAYALGVNEGLQALDARPVEYALLGTRPERWRPEDSVLVIDAMYFELEDGFDRHEAAYEVMHKTLPGPVFAFLLPRGTPWDAPVLGGPIAMPPVPGADVFDLAQALRGHADTGAGSRAKGSDEIKGSNNWAVGGALTEDGSAILANDMHLGLRLPNTWYRARWILPDSSERDGKREVTGVTLPGVPAMVVGSNRHVAWGFTDSYGDWSDLVNLHTDADHPGAYLTPDGYQRFTLYQETIKVAGAPDRKFAVRDTIWGPVLPAQPDGVLRAIHWLGAIPSATNLGLAAMERAHDVEAALDIAESAGLPDENFVAADENGNIGWTIAGRIPQRKGHVDWRLPQDWSKGDIGWDGWLKPDEYPRIVNPKDDRIWTANARVVDGKMLRLIGDGGYPLGARAGQIRDDLKAVDKTTPEAMLHIQLDDRALFLTHWHDLLMDVLDTQALKDHPRRVAFRHALEEWGGRASVDSVGYRLVREFRDRVSSDEKDAIFGVCKQVYPEFRPPHMFEFEGPLWAMISSHARNFLPPGFVTWRALFLHEIDSLLKQDWSPGGGLVGHTWGERNMVRIRHPLSSAVPLLGAFLDAPVMALPGDSNMPRVQAPAFGASERMVVSPGHEAEGIFHMPGGQSGNPLSPYYLKGLDAWANGEATPFLPGEPQHVLRFEATP